MLANYTTTAPMAMERDSHLKSGLQANGGTMLLLTYLITADRRWRDAWVKVITVVNSEEEQTQAKMRLQHRRALDSALKRLFCSQIYVDQYLMAQYSQDADLAIVGMRLPGEEDDANKSFMTIIALASLPTTIMIHSGGAFKAAPVLFDND